MHPVSAGLLGVALTLVNRGRSACPCHSHRRARNRYADWRASLLTQTGVIPRCLPPRCACLSCSPGDFQLGKFHKGVAAAMAAAAGGEAQAAVKALAIKTRELISTLKSLGGEGGQVALADIQARRMNPSMETFLWNVATAEGFAKAPSS